MPNYNSILKRLPPNAVGRRRIESIEEEVGNNYYVTGGAYDSGDEELDFTGVAGFPAFSVDVSGIIAAGSSPLTTKGDIYVFGTTNTRLPVGTDSYALVADSSTATGLNWAANSDANYYPSAVTLSSTNNYLTLTGGGGMTTISGNLSTFPSAVTFQTGLAVGGQATAAGYIDFLEDADDGDHYIRLQAAAMAANITLKLPTTVGTNGYALVTDGNSPAQLSWASNSDANYYTSSAAINSNIITGTMTGGGSNWTVDIGGLTSLGTISTGIWNGTAITDTYVSSASNWNDAYNNYVASAAYSAGTLTFTQRDGGTFTASGFQQGTMSSWILTGDAGSTAISDGDTLDWQGGTGIDTSVNGLICDIAVDNTVVRTTGVQSIAGAKTFSSLLTASSGLTVASTTNLQSTTNITGNTNIKNGGRNQVILDPTLGASTTTISDSGTTATAAGYYPRLLLSQIGTDATEFADYPSIYFTKYGPISNLNVDQVAGWRQAMSGSSGTGAGDPQYMVWDYNDDTSGIGNPPSNTWSNKLELKSDGTLTTTTFAGALSGTIDTTTTATTQNASNNSTKVATTAYVDAAVSSSGGGGDVSKVGTPVDNQIGIWTGDGTIEGSADFTFDGSTIIADADIKIKDGEKLLIGDDSGLQFYGNDGSTKYITALEEQLLIWNQDASSAPIKIQATDTSNGIQFNIAGTEMGRFTSTGLGIGNTTAIGSGKLTVKDTAGVPLTLAYDGSNYTTFSVNSGGNTVIQAHHGNLELKSDIAAKNIRMDSKGDFRVDLGDSAGTYAMRVRAADNTGLLYAVSDGPVGIGTESNTTEALWITDTASPDADTNLILQQGSGGGGGFRIWDDTPAETAIFAQTSSSILSIKNFVQDKDIQFSVNDGGSQTTAMTIDGPTANVGIGITDPIQPLHVLTSANDKGILIDVSDNTHEGRLIFGDVASNGVGHIGYNHSMETMRFNVGGYETVRLANDGSYSKLFLGADSTLGFYRYSNRMDFYVASNPRLHLNSSTLYASNATGAPSIDLYPDSSTATYGFYGDTDTGMSRAAADELSLITAGTTRMTISSAGNATFTEAVTLGDNSVTNTQSAGNNTTRLATTEFVTTAVAAAGTIGGSIAEDRIAVGTSTANTITGTSRFEWDEATLTMTNTGNTGITLLGDSDRSSADAHAMAMRGKWDGTAIGTVMIATGPDDTNKDDGQILFYTASAGTQTERMRIDETGNIGIGTTDPASTLHIEGDATNFRISSADYDLITMGPRGSTGSNLDKAFINLMSGDGSSKVYFDTAADSYINGGNLGIGTAGPATKLDVLGSITAGANSYTTISNNEYDVSSGNLLFDVAGDITLDAGGSDIKLSKAGGNKASFYLTTNDVYFQLKAADGDLYFTGMDDTSQITALHFDMSEAGLATFNTPPVVGTMTSSDDSTKAASTAFVTTAVAAAGGGDVTKVGTPANNQIGVWTGDGTIEGDANLTFDGTNRIDLVPSNSEAKIFLGAGNVVLAYTGSTGKLNSANRTLLLGNSGAEIKMLNGTDDSMHFYTNGSSTTGTERLTILSGGNVGIGTDTPAQLLDVSGSMKLFGAMYLNNYLGAGSPTNPGTNYLWASGSTLFWGGSQIGTTTPGAGAIQGTATAGEVAYGDGNNSITSTSNFTFTDDDGMTITSATANKPVLTLENTNVDAYGPKIVLKKNGSSPADSDTVGTISFLGENDADESIEYANIVADQYNDADGEELGRLVINTYDYGSSPTVYPAIRAYGGNVRIYQGNTNYINFMGGNEMNSTTTLYMNYSTANAVNIARNALYVQPYNSNTSNPRVGIGTTGPSQKLDVVAADVAGTAEKGATIRVGSNAGATLNKGGSIVFGDTGTDRAMIKGSYLGGSSEGQLTFSTAADSGGALTARMTINEDGVGIGAAPTSNLLYVNGNMRTEDYLHIDKDASPGLLVGEGGDADIYYDGSDMRINSRRVQSGAATGHLLINTGGGSVGIGTTSPNSELDVLGDIRITNKNGSNPTDAGSLIFEESGDNWGSSLFGFRINLEGSSNYLNFQSANQSTIKDILTLTRDTAHVGIGTTLPDKLLHIHGGTDTAFKMSNDGVGEGNSDGFEILQANGGDITLKNRENAALKFDTSGTNRMIIDSAGLVGIGTPSPAVAVHVSGATTQELRVNAGNSGQYARVQLRSATDGYCQFNMGDTGADAAGGLVYTHSTDTLNIRAANANIANVTATGVAITGVLSATAKSFNIPHPLYKDKRLVHGSLEGPEHGIYIRGTIETKEKGCLVELPEYWSAMCEDYTVQLTPHGAYTVYIKEKQKDKVMVECSQEDFKFDYYIVGSRTDETLEVVQDA